METVLVVGGAGYIGSYMCKCLARLGRRPVVLDNFVTGRREAVRWGPLVEGSLSDAQLIRRVLSRYRIDAVMHFAASAYVGESVEKPLAYYRNNVANTLNLIEAMVESGVLKFVFSSSCAVYGNPIEIPITEQHPQDPINPYGKTKVMVEKILEDAAAAHGLEYVSLRYFNAAGADPEGELGEGHRPETHLIPLVLQTALGRRDAVQIFGDDYPTRDGTCIRDYIHIDDLAQAHVAALEQMTGRGCGRAYNLGNGDGYSVREVIEMARSVTGRPISCRIAPRRPGDPAILVGSGRKAERELGWKPGYCSLETIIETAWRWHQDHPGGYGAD